MSRHSSSSTSSNGSVSTGAGSGTTASKVGGTGRLDHRIALARAAGAARGFARGCSTPHFGHIAGVRAFGVLEAVMLLVGVKMAARRGKGRRLALGGRMDVHRMFSGRQVLEVQLDSHAGTAFSIRQRGHADALAFGVLQIHFHRLVGANQSGGG